MDELTVEELIDLVQSNVISLDEARSILREKGILPNATVLRIMADNSRG